MRVLLDSHVLLWWIDDPARLASPLRNVMHDPANEVFFSPASIWELGLKMAKGKLRVPLNLVPALASDGIVELPISAAHVTRTLTLPTVHFDPFDRLLIGQALVEGLVLATRDETIHRYDVPVIEA